MRFMTLLCALFLFVSSVVAHAQLLLTLDIPNQAAVPGDTLTYSGTVLNNGTSVIFLNGVTYTLSANDLTLDPSSFLDNAPTSLAPTQSWYGDLFTIMVDPNLPLAPTYNLFTVTGGSDANSQDNLVTSQFGVDVPEPNALLCTLVGLASGIKLLRRRSLSVNRN